MRMPTAAVAGIVVLALAPAEGQERPGAQTRLFVAPIANLALHEGGGPTRYEYLERLLDAPECAGIVPVGREDAADFVVWFEFEEHFGGIASKHYMTLWDASGNRVAGDKARRSAEIMTAVCDAITAELADD